MFNNVVLDVVIGLVFIFLLYSLLASIVHEIIATNLAFRAKILEKAIARMLDDGPADRNPVVDRLSGYLQLLGRTKYLEDKKFAASFYGHPLVKYLAEDKWHSKPSYLESGNFSKVVIDLLHGLETDLHGTNILKIKESLAAGQLRLADFASAPIDTEGTANNVLQDINPQTQRFLQSLLSDAQGDINKFRSSLEKWFDNTMERASGWYKKYTQVGLLITGFVIAVAFNVDTIAIVNKLSADPKMREKLVQQASSYVKQHKTEMGNVGGKTDLELSQKRDSLIQKADSLLDNEIKSANQSIGLGWAKGFGNIECVQQGWGVAILGWLITALALSLGAPFWFDLLSKLVKIRGAGGKSDSGVSQGTTNVSVQPAITVNTNNTGEEAVG